MGDSDDASDDAHVGASEDTSEAIHVGAARRRAKQSIPPAVRRHVLRRDAGRCRVPGCRHAVYVDVHHVDPRAEGGQHGADNLVTLCAAHHRAVHCGAVVIERAATGELRFRHADGSDYGAGQVSPRVADARAKAFRALRSMGFRESEARRAADRAVAHVGTTASVETILRQALALLTPRSRL